MKIRSSIPVIVLLLLISGCYPGISGLVVDAETEKPLEGAVVLAQWTKSHGMWDPSHTVYKIVETETDQNGKFSLSGVYNPTVDAPELVIYKKGFVAWRNDIVFPSYTKRTHSAAWASTYIYKLEKFKEGFSRDQHLMFIEHGIIGADCNKTPKYCEAIGYELRESNKKNRY